MNKHEEKLCPRCSRKFECKAGNIAQCQCSSIKLTEKTIAFIEKQYTDCLCITCLNELAQEPVGAENN